MKPVTNQIYHVLNKSIAGYKIFNSGYDFQRFLEISLYYQGNNVLSFSHFVKHKQYKNELSKLVGSHREKRVEIIAYCLMPTHFHFILKQLEDSGIPRFLSDTLNSYTRYFNTRYKRKGPLWQGRTKKILVQTDEQLLHLTRYIHLNPATAYLVDKPQDWIYSSYKEYLNNSTQPQICKFNNLIEIDTHDYKEFVSDTIDYQRNLKKMKDLLTEL
jgi:putative transposase